MSGGGVKLRTFTSVNLAWWHSFKHGVGSIWKAYANTIWAPLWQRLYPGTLFYAKARSPQEGSMHLVYMLKAYPAFRKPLKEALVNPDISKAGMSMLHNIQFLCEFAIPVVPNSTRKGGMDVTHPPYTCVEGHTLRKLLPNIKFNIWKHLSNS